MSENEQEKGGGNGAPSAAELAPDRRVQSVMDDWYKLTDTAERAIAARQEAERLESFARGQCKILMDQHEVDQKTIASLSAQLEDAKAKLGTAMGLVLDVAQSLGLVGAKREKKATGEAIAQVDKQAEAFSDEAAEMVGKRFGANARGRTPGELGELGAAER